MTLIINIVLGENKPERRKDSDRKKHPSYCQPKLIHWFIWVTSSWHRLVCWYRHQCKWTCSVHSFCSCPNLNWDKPAPPLLGSTLSKWTCPVCSHPCPNSKTESASFTSTGSPLSRAAGGAAGQCPRVLRGCLSLSLVLSPPAGGRCWLPHLPAPPPR